MDHSGSRLDGYAVMIVSTREFIQLIFFKFNLLIRFAAIFFSNNTKIPQTYFSHVTISIGELELLIRSQIIGEPRSILSNNVY